MTNTTNANPRYDSAADATATTGDDRHVIATYLSDMLALEKHIGAPLDKQAGDENVGSFADAASLTARIQTFTDAHERALQTQLDALGGHPAAGVKSAWSEFLGNAAAAIGGSRKMKVSKHLRDDYTALALASISYTMLHATALGLGDQATAALAKQCLDDYAPLVVEIGKAIPGIVLEELRADGENVQVSAAEIAERNTSASWSKA